MSIREEIVRITSEYFEDEIDYIKLLKATNEFKSLLNEICEQDMLNEVGRNDIGLENGKALGTYWAALCLDDMWRTRQFIRGIDKAIKDKINTKKPLHILYAGTGPYATLILPIIFRYSNLDIKYTFIEINPNSFTILKNIISKLGLEEYNISLVNEDATKYKINPDDNPDIIISETMQRALSKEQQVSIFSNLMRQAKNDTLFIPEKIELYIGLRASGIPMEELHAEHFYKFDKVFEVSKDAMITNNTSEKGKNNEALFPKKQTIIDSNNMVGFSQLLIITDIQVYKSEKIGINQSALTTPKHIGNVPENRVGPMTIETQYVVSSEPKLDYKITLGTIV